MHPHKVPTDIHLSSGERDELPLPVVPDWRDQLRRATALCRLIDRHLDTEANARILRHPKLFRPQDLCPEQRVQMVSDLTALIPPATPAVPVVR